MVEWALMNFLSVFIYGNHSFYTTCTCTCMDHSYYSERTINKFTSHTKHSITNLFVIFRLATQQLLWTVLHGQITAEITGIEHIIIIHWVIIGSWASILATQPSLNSVPCDICVNQVCIWLCMYSPNAELVETSSVKRKNMRALETLILHTCLALLMCFCVCAM